MARRTTEGALWCAALCVACVGQQPAEPPPENAASGGGAEESGSEGANVSNDTSPDEPQRFSLDSPEAQKGRVPPAVIQGIVRSSFHRFRTCYEAGLQEDSSLEGRVSVRFVIGLDGRVTEAAEADGDLPDEQVRACVVAAFKDLQFPKPDGGVVTVVYPVMFAPGPEEKPGGAPPPEGPLKAPMAPGRAQSSLK